MKDLYLDNFYKLDLYGKSSKKPYNRGKSFGYQVLGFGSGVSSAGFLPTQLGIFAFGEQAGGPINVSNLVNASGVIASNTTGVGQARSKNSGAGYGGDKGIFGFGDPSSDDTGESGITNLVNNLGVVASDTAAVASAHRTRDGATYGGDKAIFAFGNSSGSATNNKNLVNNLGVVAEDSSGAGTARQKVGATAYGDDLAIFAFGGGSLNTRNLVNNVGVVAADATGAGSGRFGLCGFRFGSTGEAIFGYGRNGAAYLSMSNKVNNVGVVATDSASVAVARTGLGGCRFGGDKGIFAYGNDGFYSSHSNLVNSSGTVASDVDVAGTDRISTAALGYSI